MQTQHQQNIDPTRPNHPVTEKQTSFEDNTTQKIALCIMTATTSQKDHTGFENSNK